MLHSNNDNEPQMEICEYESPRDTNASVNEHRPLVAESRGIACGLGRYEKPKLTDGNTTPMKTTAWEATLGPHVRQLEVLLHSYTLLPPLDCSMSSVPIYIHQGEERRCGEKFLVGRGSAPNFRTDQRLSDLTSKHCTIRLLI